jgi:hypothetical protein
MRFSFVLWFSLLFGEALALAQDFAPPHAGAAANGGSGGLTDCLLPIVVIVIGVLILTVAFKLLTVVFNLLVGLLSLPEVLWRKLREVLRR